MSTFYWKGNAIQNGLIQSVGKIPPISCTTKRAEDITTLRWLVGPKQAPKGPLCKIDSKKNDHWDHKTKRGINMPSDKGKK